MITFNKSQFIISISSIVLGILFLAIPGKIMNILFYIVGATLIAFGITNIFILIKKNKIIDENKILVGIDALLILLGILIIVLSNFFIAIFVIIVSIAFMLYGGFGIYTTICIYKERKSVNIIGVITSTFSLLIGLLLIIDYFTGNHVIMYFLGSLLILFGLFIGINMYKMYKDDNKRKQKIKDKILDVEAKEIPTNE